MNSLIDAGPLIALIDRGDSDHRACIEYAMSLPVTNVFETSWAAFVEAMHILGSRYGYKYQRELWNFRAQEILRITDMTEAEIDRAAELMALYADRPMDLADATLVAIAESRKYRRIFTLDSDYRFYRLRDGTVLDIFPN